MALLDFAPATWRRGFFGGALRCIGGLCVVMATLNGASSVSGQTPQPTHERQSAVCENVDEAAAELLQRNNINYVALLRTRGIDFPELAVTAAFDRLKTWLSSRRTRDAVILMGHDGRRHCAYLIDADGIAAFGSSAISPSLLSRLDAEWRASSGVDSVGRGRREGVRVSGARMPAPQLTARFGSNRAALEALATALLPGDVRRIALRYQHIYVIPYDNLGVVPYSALPSGRGDTQLVDHVSISIAPNAYVFLGADIVARIHRSTPCGERRTRGQASIVVGDPLVEHDSEWRFPALPGARREAYQVARTLGVAPLIGPAATRDAFFAAASEAQFVHVAAHGVAVESPSAAALAGFLALSDFDPQDPEGRGGNLDRGRANADAIQNACIPARLVVLSGCQTGLGGQHAGGVIGLTRAFHIAGADEVVMSLWSVDDAATEQLMYLFWTRYVQRGEDETASDALRAAMIELRREYPNPRLWAPFEVFGVPG